MYVGAQKTYHEERMVSSGTDDAHFNAVFWVPLKEKYNEFDWIDSRNNKKKTHPRKSIEDIDVITGVEIIDGTLSVDFEGI